MKKFQVELNNNNKRDYRYIDASYFSTEKQPGELVFFNEEGRITAVFAAGSWRCVTESIGISVTTGTITIVNDSDRSNWSPTFGTGNTPTHNTLTNF